MTKFKNIRKDQLINKIIREFVNSNHKTNNLLFEGLDKKSNLYYAIQLGEEIGKQIQVDIITEYLNEHEVLKEDIFQRGLAKLKAPIGKGYDKGVIQNLFNAFQKNTNKIVSAGPSPFTPSQDDVKNNPTQIGKVGALIGQRFAALQNNPRLNAPATPTEQQAGMGRIEKLISQIRSSGLVKGSDKSLDEIAIFARQHPVLTNLIVGGLISVLTLSSGGGLFGIPLLGKFLTGTALRTLIGMLKGETAAQAATKGALVSGAGIAIGKLLGLFYDKISAWLSGQPTPDIQQVVGPQTLSGPKPGPSYPFSNQDPEAMRVGYQGDDLGPVPPQPDAPYQDPEAMRVGYQGDDLGNVPSVQPQAAPVAAPAAPVAAPSVAPVVAPSVDISSKLGSLNQLADTSSIKGGFWQTGQPQQAIKAWVDGVTKPQADAMLKDPQIYKQLMRKGVLGSLQKKFGISENIISDIDIIKAELMGVSALSLNEADKPGFLSRAKNFVFGGPKVGGDNARLDYKQVESDYLKFLNNAEKVLKLDSEEKILDFFKSKSNEYPGIYDYMTKVRNWLYGPTPVSKKPEPEPVMSPPGGAPPGGSIPPDQTKKDEAPPAPGQFPSGQLPPGQMPQDQIPPVPTQPQIEMYKNLSKCLLDLKSSPLFSGNMEERIVQLLYVVKDTNTLDKQNLEGKEKLIALKTFLIDFSKVISNASAEVRKKIGDPNSVRQEITSDPQFATLKEANTHTVELAKLTKDRKLFLDQFNAAVPNIVCVLFELRQLFNRKNPNNIYSKKNPKSGVTTPTPTKPGPTSPSPVSPTNPILPNPNLTVPNPKTPLPQVTPFKGEVPRWRRGGQYNFAGYGDPMRYSQQKLAEDLSTQGKPAQVNPGASGNLTGPDIANARAMFAFLISLGPILQKVNPNSLTKLNLKELIVTFLDVADILVYKKGSKKTNKRVDTALQGMDIIGHPGKLPPGQKKAGEQPQQTGGFEPKEKTLVRADVEEKPLTPKAIYQYFGKKWNIVTKKGLQPIDPKGGASLINKLNDLAKNGRNDYDRVIGLLKTKKGQKGKGVDFDLGNQIKEGVYKLSDYKKFFC